ncbi:MAG: dihydroorotase [Patescibacteria group bacterium]|jgi:dihydroorotase
MSETQTLTIRQPDDFHVHLRQGQMLKDVLPHSAGFGRLMVMPNIVPPVLNADDASRYMEEIVSAMHLYPRRPTIIMSLQVIPNTKPEDIKFAMNRGVRVGKVYPKGMTTNSENGVEDYRSLHDVFGAMEEVGMILSLHGEHPSQTLDCLDREAAFMDILVWINQTFPKLKIVLEHVTTTIAVTNVMAMPDNVSATITVHHLFLTLNNVIGHMLKPHHFCKPVAKRFTDRSSLVAAATSGNRKFFLGTDSAPHLKEKKECADGCAGIFTAPVALPLLAELFERQSALKRLEDFTSRFGAEFYGLPLNKGTVMLEKTSWRMPGEISGVIPFMAGETILWQVKS